MLGQYRKLSTSFSVNPGTAELRLRVAATAAELDGIQINHLARIVDANEHVIGRAVVGGIDDACNVDVVVYDRLPGAAGPCTLELDINSRWPYSLPRRGGDLPRLTPPKTPPTIDASPNRKLERQSPFVLAFRPTRTPARPTPGQSVQGTDPARMLVVSPTQWTEWGLATATSQTRVFRHSWDPSLRLISVAAPDQAMTVSAPISGTFMPSPGYVEGRRIDAGEMLGTVHLSGRYVRLLESLAAEVVDRAAIHNALVRNGADAATIHLLLADPKLRHVAVLAPMAGAISMPPIEGAVNTGQRVASVIVGAHTVAYGTVPPSMPIPRQVDAEIRLGGASDIFVSGAPLLEINHESRRFAISLPFATLAPAFVSARLAATKPSGEFVAIPRDCLTRVHRSSEVLVHTGSFAITRHPVRVKQVDRDHVYVDGLPAGVDLVRDLDAVSKLIPPVRSLMLGLGSLF